MAREHVSIESDGRTLSGRLFTPAEPNGGAVLFTHGYGARGRNCEQYAKQLLKDGITSLTFDLGGHGDSGGDANELSVNDHLIDVSRAHSFLTSPQRSGVDSRRIGIAGMSYGGYLAALLSADRVVKSLLLRSPPLYPQDVRNEPRRMYSDVYALEAEPDPDDPTLATLHGFAGRVLLVVAEHDTVVPARVTDAYRQAIPGIESRTLEGASHNLDAESQLLFKPMVAEWAHGL